MKILVTALAALLLFAACFTEVGNPDEEPSMSASVHVDYTAHDTGAGPDSARLTAFTMRFLGAVYRDADSSEHALWASRNGQDFDFLAGATLARAKLDSSAPVEAVVRLGSSPLAGFITGSYVQGGVARAFRFALPDSLAFSLRYDSAALGAWRTGGDYACRFTFYPRRWLALSGLDTAVVSLEEAGQSVAIFDAGHNPELYKALLKNFYGAFNGPRDYSGKKSGPP